MNIIERVKKILGINSPEMIAERIVTSFQERKENGEKDPIDNTVKEAKRIINENPDIAREIAKEILKEFIENEKIPESLFEKTAKEIALTPEIPDIVISQAVQQTEKQVPGKVIEKIIEEGNVNPKARLELIQNVEEVEIIKRRVKNELKILYSNCKGKQDREIVDRLQEIEGVLESKDITGEIQDLVYQVVSKKMAENYYDDKLRATKIYEFSQIISFEEMIESGLPEMVEKEYQMIEEKGEEKPDRFSKTKLTQLILDKMANDIAKKYGEIGIIAIPQSEYMKKLSSEEEKSFIKAIQNFSEKFSKKRNLSREDIKDIHEQIRGNIASNEIKKDMLAGKIKKMPDEYLDTLIAIIENPETLKTLEMMKKSGLIGKLNSMPEEKREKRIAAVDEVLEKREIARQTLKMPGNPQVDIFVEDDSDQR